MELNPKNVTVKPYPLHAASPNGHSPRELERTRRGVATTDWIKPPSDMFIIKILGASKSWGFLKNMRQSKRLKITPQLPMTAEITVKIVDAWLILLVPKKKKRFLRGN